MYCRKCPTIRDVKVSVAGGRIENEFKLRLTKYDTLIAYFNANPKNN